MNKSDDQIYIDQLKKNLKQLPIKEYDDAIQYYTEYLEDLNTSDYSEIVRRLGTPKKLARQLEANYLITEDDNQTKQSKKKSINHNLKLIITILLALSSPILIIIAGSLLIAFSATVFGIGLAIIVTSFVGISLLVVGITGVMSKGIISLLVAGAGCIVIGVILTLTSAIYFIVKFIIQKMVIFFKFIYGLYQTKISKNGGM